MWGAFTFSRAGAKKSLLYSKGNVPNCQVQRRQRRRLPDLVCYYLVKLTGFQVGDTEGVLAGMTKSAGRSRGVTGADRAVK